MKKNILTIFNEYVPVKFDKRFLKDVLTYNRNFIRKNDEHINFFGGNLIGVYLAKWTDEDRMVWVEDILDIKDIDGLRTELHELEDIDPNYHVSSDVINLSFIWATYRVLKSKDFSRKDQERLSENLMNMLQYKFLTSAHTHNFKFKANEDISLAVYESLERKSTLKREGTWGNLVQHRSEDILDKGSIHYKTIRDLTDTYEVVKLLNDIQGRIKSIVHNLTDKFYEIRDKDARMGSSSNFKNLEGEIHLKDSASKYENVRMRLHDTIPRRNDFIKEDLLEVIIMAVSTTSTSQVERTLEYLCNNYNSRKGIKEYRPMVEKIVIYCFDLIRQEKMDLDDVPALILKLRAMLRSSRVVNQEVLDVRETCGELVADALNTKSASTIPSTRIAVILYIALFGLM